VECDRQRKNSFGDVRCQAGDQFIVSVTESQRSYGISVERFKVGQITTEDLVQSQRRLTDAKISNLSALIDYKLAIADLKRKTLYDFEKNVTVRVKQHEQE
jgi:ABC-type uncharacterized transport system fused permease/ATPase subunit